MTTTYPTLDELYRTRIAYVVAFYRADTYRDCWQWANSQYRLNLRVLRLEAMRDSW